MSVISTNKRFLDLLKTPDRRYLSRTITEVENAGPSTQDILTSLKKHPEYGLVVGITGAPGAGKSTLIDAIIAEYRTREKTVAVVTVDPSSPFSKGAILGDRCRMGRHIADKGVFIRSLASRGHLGGLSGATERVIEVLNAAAFDIIIVETVGTGQSEVEIAKLAQITIVICTPGAGDDIQTMKAGILEIADIFVVNKADLPLADVMVNHLRTLSAAQKRKRQVPVIPTVAIAGRNVPELIDTLMEIETG